MRKILKNASESLKISKILTIYILFINSVQSQEAKFLLKDDNFTILENNTTVYNDFKKIKSGSCSEIQIIDSSFKNQFYFYIENTCTSTVTKQLYKINWIKGKFQVLSKELIVVNKEIISCKNIYYENFILDSLDVSKLEKEEIGLFVNKNKLKNKVPVFYKRKILGYRTISSEQVKYKYPIFEDYQNINKNIILYNNVAYVLYKNNSLEEAISILSKIIKLEPNRIVAHLNIADCYWELNDKEKAVLNYKKYLELMKIQKKNLNKIPKYVYERIL